MHFCLRSMTKHLRHLIIIVLIAGCATTVAPEFAGNRDKVAVIEGYNSFVTSFSYWGRRDVQISKIDKYFPGSTTLLTVGEGYALPAGRHTVTVNVNWIGGSSFVRSEEKIAFEAEEGGLYQVQAINHGVGPWGIGGEKFLWILDKLSGEVVGGQRPPSSGE